MFYCLGTHLHRAVICGGERSYWCRVRLYRWSKSPLPPWTWCIGGFWETHIKLKVHGWLPRGMFISPPQSGCPQRWSDGQPLRPHSVPARMDLLFPAGHRGWVWLLSPRPYIVLSVSGLRICTKFIPWAPPREALFGLLPDSLLRAKNIPFFSILFLVTQSCPTLYDPIDCSPPGSSVHEILQARILEWAAHSLLQEGEDLQKIFPTQGLNLGLPTLQADSLASEPLGKRLLSGLKLGAKAKAS